MIFKPMLAKGGECSDAKAKGKIFQIKYDGTRTFLIKNGSKVELMGARNWKNDYAPRHPQITADARKIPSKQCVLDCELTFFKKGTKKDVFLTALAGKATHDPIYQPTNLPIYQPTNKEASKWKSRRGAMWATLLLSR